MSCGALLLCCGKFANNILLYREDQTEAAARHGVKMFSVSRSESLERSLGGSTRGRAHEHTGYPANSRADYFNHIVWFCCTFFLSKSVAAITRNQGQRSGSNASGPLKSLVCREHEHGGVADEIVEQQQLDGVAACEAVSNINFPKPVSHARPCSPGQSLSYRFPP